jgi:hypothetical protein
MQQRSMKDAAEQKSEFDAYVRETAGLRTLGAIRVATPWS